MAQPEPDPFASLITANCHVTHSQSALHRSAPFVRYRELFPGDSSSSSQYNIPVETTAIRMESPRRTSSSLSRMNLPPPSQWLLREKLGLRLSPNARERELGSLLYSLKRKEDKVFDKMSMRKLETKTGSSAEASDLRESCGFYVRKKQATKKGMSENIGNGVKQNGVINNNISSTQTIDLDEDEECADLPVRNSREAKMGPDGHIKIEIVDDLDDVEVPRRNGDVDDLHFPKGDDVCNKGKGATRVLPSWVFNKDGFLIKNDDANKATKKIDGVEKNVLEIDKSKPIASSQSGKTKEDEIMKNLLDGLDLVISIENEKVDNNSEPYKKVDVLGAALRRGLICTRRSWWPPEKKIPERGVAEGSGRV